ncbi:MAG: AI-2E family transporter [Crocinitomicaceae bacterium]|nr:AI-2E family transporter [Crocinitomicaceae bacterium]
MILSRMAYQLIVIALILAGLYLGQHLIIPFIVALVVWYLLNSLGDLFGKIKFKKKSMPRIWQLLLGLVLFLVVSFMIIQLVISNFEVFEKSYPVYHNNFIILTESISKTYEIDLSSVKLEENFNLPTLLAGAVDSSLGFVASFFLVLLYVIFLLLEQQIFQHKIRLIFNERTEYVKFLGIVKKVDESIHSYVTIKTSLCFLGGVLSYIVMLILQVDFAFLWAFLIFLFNFIPIIGAFIGVLFPSLIAILQFGSWLEPVLVISLLSAIQLVLGNLVEPKILGTKLNLSPLVVIISLSFWGALWGVAGMFLCVPITVMLMIVFAQFKETKNIAILLSGGRGV